MIKKFIKKVFGSRRKTAALEPRIYPRKEHGIKRADNSHGALTVCEGLQQKGFKAFIVGGAVRDLLIGRHPKDFDVATDATPEEVRNVFRRSRIIGRRFRLVHVMFGQETVEVSTFRANHPAAEVDEVENDDDDFRQKKAHADEHGRLLRDNVFGNMEEDAIRRDFTMNALFYDPQREEVWDYVDGYSDIKKKRVVMIGDPLQRYREDPVRMLRAARLAGKLGFTIDKPTEAPIAELIPLLTNVPTSRLFDEMLKLLFSGHALDSVSKLIVLGLHRCSLPSLDKIMADDHAKRFVMLALQRTDERIALDKGVSPAFLFAALYWPGVEAAAAQHHAAGVPVVPAMHLAMDEVLDERRKSLAMPRRYDAMVKELWIAQPRFLQRSRAKAYRTLSHPRFRASYDFFELRAEAGDADIEIAKWWERFQFADEAERETMLLPDEGPKKKRRKRKSGGSQTATVTPE